MKRYRLNQTAFKNLKQTLTAIAYIILAFLFMFGMVSYPLLLLGVESNIVTVGSGIISWTILFSTFVINFKRWLLENLEERL